MSKKQLLIFSLALMLLFGNGSGIATMIPVYLSRLGISSDRIGFLFSLLYLSIGGAGILAGWLVDRFGHRKQIAVLTVVGEVVSAVLLLLVKTFPAVSAAFMISWFVAGAHAAVVSAMVALQAHEDERGRVFGLIGFITGVGTVLSGFFYGRIVDAYGFHTLLVLNLVFAVLWLVLTLFYRDSAAPLAAKSRQTGGASLPIAFWLAVFAAVLGWVAINGGKLGITLVMNGLNFSPGDISLTTGIASLAALAVPLLLGWLSDRTGRKPILLALNFLGLAGLFLLSRGGDLAAFSVASSLLSLYGCFSGLFNALVTDLLPARSLGFGLALVNSASYIAGIFSSTLVGISIKSMGNQLPFLLGMVLPLVAALFLASISEKRQAGKMDSFPREVDGAPG